MSRPLINELGNKYGSLTVLKRAGNRRGRGAAYWLCTCECGNETVVCGTSLRERTNSYVCRHTNRKNKLQGRDFTREQVRKRDDYTCHICSRQWKHGEKRFDVAPLIGINSKKYNKVSETDALVTLCHSCNCSRKNGIERRILTILVDNGRLTLQEIQSKTLPDKLEISQIYSCLYRLKARGMIKRHGPGAVYYSVTHKGLKTSTRGL